MNKAVVAIVAVVVIGALVALSVLSSGGGGGNSIGLSQDELNRLADKDLGAREKFELASNAEGRKEYVGQIREFFALANEALRRKLKDPAHVQVLTELGQTVALRQAYLDKHAAEMPGPAGPQLTPEEIDAWAEQHKADVDRIKEALKTGDKPGPPVDGKQLAGLYLVAEKAKQEGLDKDPAVKDDLVLQGKLVLVNILAGAVQEALQEETKYSEADVAAYYNAKAPLGELDVVHAAHILIPTRPLPSPVGGPAATVDPAAALSLANDVLTRARAGEDFGELAKQFSGDPGSKQNGGDLGSQPLFSYVPEFSEATARLKPGEISDVVKTDFGYHVIKLIERQPPPPLTPQLQSQLQGQLSQLALKRKVDAIVRDFPPDIPDDFTVTAPAELPPEPPPLQLSPEDMMPSEEDLEEEGAHPSAAPPEGAKAPAKPTPPPAKGGAAKATGKSQ